MDAHIPGLIDIVFSACALQGCGFFAINIKKIIPLTEPVTNTVLFFQFIACSQTSLFLYHDHWIEAFLAEKTREALFKPIK